MNRRKSTKHHRGRRPRYIAIYEIWCRGTNKYYIGSSKDVCMRWNSHIWSLVSNTHVSKALYDQVLENGINSISFRVLEILDRNTEPSTIREIEQAYMNKYPKHCLLNLIRARREPT